MFLKSLCLNWLFAAFVAVVGLAQPAMADDLQMPKGEVVLIISGAIGATNLSGEAHLDREMLQAMGLEEVLTTTPWTEGRQQFQGVPLHSLVDLIKPAGKTLRLKALNDYWVDLPLSEALEPGPLLAIHSNGVALSARDKGPIWLVYPYDADEKFRTEVSYARSVWQLSRIEVLP